MGSLAQRHGGSRAWILEPPHGVNPRPGRVHDRAGVDRDDRPADPIGDLRIALADRDDLCVVEHDGIPVGRRAHVREAQARVVRLCVDVQPGCPDAVDAQRRNERQSLVRPDGAAAHPLAGERPVEPERRADRGLPVRPALVDGQDERQSVDEMGRDRAEQRLPLCERLAYQPEVTHPQIAQPAVDQLRRRA